MERTVPFSRTTRRSKALITAWSTSPSPAAPRREVRGGKRGLSKLTGWGGVVHLEYLEPGKLYVW